MVAVHTQQATVKSHFSSLRPFIDFGILNDSNASATARSQAAFLRGLDSRLAIVQFFEAA